MKKEMIKKLLAATLTAVMAVSMLTGCGNTAEQSKESEVKESSATQESKQESSAASVESGSEAAEPVFEHDPVLNELGELPICNEKVTITIGMRQNAKCTDYDDNYFTDLVEEKANIDIEFVLFPAGDEGTQKLQMMVAGGEELPDIIMWKQSETIAMQWGEEGYIVPLEDYFANSSYYAVKGYARLEEQNGLNVVDYQTTADGHIWSFPSYYDSTTNPTYTRCWVYQPWLEALNLEVPTTTDEFKAMLLAFKTQDPNGNGKADEIPMIGSEIAAKGSGAFHWEFLMNAFQHSTAKKDFLVSTDGQLSVSYNTEGWKEGIKYINELVTEGLLDPVSFTQTNDTFLQFLNASGDPTLGCFVSMSTAGIDQTHPTREQWILIEPLTGPDGYSSTALNLDLPTDCAYITEYCEHPEVAFRVLDLLCDDYMTLTGRWGKEGENWDYVENLINNEEWKKAYPLYADYKFDQTWMGYPAYWMEYNNAHNNINNVTWKNEHVSFRTGEVAGSFYAAGVDPTINSANTNLANHLSAYYAVAPKEGITKIKYSSVDLSAEATEINEEIKSYVFEKIAAWATGAADVEAEWDSYLKELETIGLSRMLEIMQQGWK